ncbi:MAG: glycosyltransferase family 4 protein [Blastochloris sp.]|nr:glycosyltransferase family 4 protein [Blastochloris sp.]
MVVIQEYSPYVVLSGLLWPKAAGRPCVVTTDVGPVLKRHLNQLQRWVHNLVNESVEGLLARTQDAWDEGRSRQKPALLAPHAVTTHFYESVRPSAQQPRRLIQVGSLIQRKGVDLLLKALVRVRNYRPEVELMLVGAGNHESR